MKHLFYKGDLDQPTLILLHGTGGDETSMLSIAKRLNPHASVLSLRGDVNENGALRFFQRLSEGQYDVVDLEKRRERLRIFLEEAAQSYQFKLNEAVLVGFSNGANIAIALLLEDDSLLKIGVLMAPMYPIDTSHLRQKKAKTRVFLSLGSADPIVPLDESYKVISEFEKRDALLEVYWVRGHEVTAASLEAAKEWLASQMLVMRSDG